MRILSIFCSLLVLLPAIAQAGVSKISGPLITKGQAVIKHLYTRTQDHQAAKDNNDAFRSSYEYDFSDNWMGEIGFNGANRYREDTRLKATTFELMHTTTRQSDGWWLSSSLIGGYAHNTDSGADRIFSRFRLQHEKDALRLRFNTALDRDTGKRSTNNDILFGTNASAVYTITPRFKPGIEWHADWGTTSQIYPSQQQKHWLGGSLYGDLLTFENNSKIEYQAGYMFGVTNAAEDGIGILVIDYKMLF